MSLEDIMAQRIQRMFFYVHAKKLRKDLVQLRIKSALKIQTSWRFIKGQQQFGDYTLRWKKAKILQRWFFGNKGKRLMAALRQDLRVRRAIALIQRLYRGHLGRKRICTKRVFLSHLHQANDAVIAANFHAGTVVDLADAIELYLGNQEAKMPVDVLTVLRAVFFILNGDEPQKISVVEFDEMEVRFISAHKLAWKEAERFLRRKGKLLRRIR
jgi:hypothetical protein